MSIELNKITALTVENVRLPGGLYNVTWDGELLTISGVKTWEQLSKLAAPFKDLGGLVTQSGNGVDNAARNETIPPPPEPTLAGPPQDAPPTPQRALRAVPGGLPAPRRPPLPGLSQAVSNAVPQTETQGGPQVHGSGDAPHPESEPSKRDQADAPPPSSSLDPADALPPALGGEDMSVFGRLVKFEQVFDEVVRRKPDAGYSEIAGMFQQLLDTEQCPALERFTKDGSLTDRIKRRCAAKGIRGALDA